MAEPLWQRLGFGTYYQYRKAVAAQRGLTVRARREIGARAKAGDQTARQTLDLLASGTTGTRQGKAPTMAPDASGARVVRRAGGRLTVQGTPEQVQAALARIGQGKVANVVVTQDGKTTTLYGGGTTVGTINSQIGEWGDLRGAIHSQAVWQGPGGKKASGGITAADIEEVQVTIAA